MDRGRRGHCGPGGGFAPALATSVVDDGPRHRRIVHDDHGRTRIGQGRFDIAQRLSRLRGDAIGMSIALVIGCAVCTALSTSGAFITDLKTAHYQDIARICRPGLNLNRFKAARLMLNKYNGFVVENLHCILVDNQSFYTLAGFHVRMNK